MTIKFNEVEISFTDDEVIQYLKKKGYIVGDHEIITLVSIGNSVKAVNKLALSPSYTSSDINLENQYKSVFKNLIYSNIKSIILV